MQHKLVQARNHRWGEGKIHLVDESAPRGVLDEPKLACGKWATAPSFMGTLREITCGSCRASIDRQLELLR